MNAKDFEGSGHDLTIMLSCHLPVEADEKP
jgi:hypothetical protein